MTVKVGAFPKQITPESFTMSWLYPISWFAGGIVLINAMPHLIFGVTGRAFPTPFAKPPGRGLSSSLINVLWGFANLLIAWWLVERVGDFDLRSAVDAGALGLGMLMTLIALAGIFGRLHGGNASVAWSDPP